MKETTQQPSKSGGNQAKEIKSDPENPTHTPYQLVSPFHQPLGIYPRVQRFAVVCELERASKGNFEG